MTEILKTKKQVADKLMQIAEAVRNAQEKKKSCGGQFYIYSSLVPLLPRDLLDVKHSLTSAKPATDADYKGANTVAISRVEYAADFSGFRNEEKLYFIQQSEKRYFIVDGLYLYYSRGYREKTAALHSLAYEDIVKDFKGRIREIITAPNKIGTFTVKKLNEWIDYNKKIVSECLQLKKAADTRIAEFRKKLRIICSDKCELNRGEVSINGVRMEWTIIETGDIYVYNKIEYPYNTGIDNFFNLINHKQAINKAINK